MRVQIAARNESGLPTEWHVVDEFGVPVREVVRFLAYLRDVDTSPMTRKAYAYDLAAFLRFLRDEGLDLDDVSNGVLARFAGWLRAPSEGTIALVDSAAVRSRATVNRALAAVAAFYTFLASAGPGSTGYVAHGRLARSAGKRWRADLTVIDSVWKANRYKHVTRLGPRLPRKVARLSILTVQQVHEILAACRTDQQRLFFTLAFTTGMRVGQILGLRHEDLDTRELTVGVVPRDDNENGVRAKTRRAHSLPIPREVSRLYSNYMHGEYGQFDSEYVFIALTGRRRGHALRPGVVDGWVQSIKRRKGIDGWSPHTLRHTYVTLQQQAGVPIDVISHLVTHASINTTVGTYSHLSVEELRAVLIRAGAWGDET